MLIKLKLDVGKDGAVKNGSVSSYKPSTKEKAMIDLVMKNWTIADEVKNKPYREFNDMSLMQRQSLDQMRFNTYQEPSPTDRDEQWKSRAVRPITRNRSISIAAHLTAAVLHPVIHAQNDNDEEDKDAAIVMRDLVEWAGDQSRYEENMVFAIIAALVNPGVILHTEYCEVYRKVKDWVLDYKDGKKPKKFETKEILDELYSGFQDSLVPLDEIWFPDFYQPDIQKQPYIIRRRTLSYDVGEAKYGEHKNFKFVKAGLQIMYIDGDEQGQFYAIQDDELRGQLVEEVIYYDRARDLQLTFLNGVLVCDPEYPNPRQDKSYPFVMFGYEPIHERFAFYKSLVNKMGTDEDVIQTLYRMVIDGTYLQLMPPQAVFGDEAVTSSVMVPGATTQIENPDTKMMPLLTNSNLSAGLSVLQKVESSATESSIDPVMAGQTSGGGGKQPSTAFEISRQEQNAKIMLGLFGKMIGFAVKKFADLRMSDILQFMTIGDVSEIVGAGGSQMKFHKFLLPNKGENGQEGSHKIEFDMDLPDEMMEEEYMERSFGLMEQEENEFDGKTRIYKVNPTLFRNLKFKTRVTADIVTPPSDAVKKALNLEAFDRAIALPFTNHQALTKDLLFGSYAKTASDPDKYMQQQAPLPGVLGADPMGANMNQPGSPEGMKAQRSNQARQENNSSVMQSGY